MEANGKIVDITRHYATGKFRVTFEFDSIDIKAASTLADKLLTVIFKQFRKKRSLDANAYCWALCTKIAEVIGSSKDEVYNQMIQRYGAIETDETGVPIKMSFLSNIDVSNLNIHIKRIGTGHVQSKEFTHYVLLKGSSKCDTKEMSVLIDGIVSECKELGIETMTPDELERMVSTWRK